MIVLSLDGRILRQHPRQFTNDQYFMKMHNEYLESSSVHGCSYIHSRNPTAARAFWFVVIASGFVAASFLIQAAFDDWEKHPVLTTLDTIAAPVQDIRFPTVTVCQDPYKQPDNWAYLETVLNTLAFSCPKNAKNEECKAKTGKIRQDFQFLIKRVVKKFKGLIYTGKLDNEVLGVGKLAKLTVDAIKNKTLSMRNVNNWPFDTFGHNHLDVTKILSDLGFTEADMDSDWTNIITCDEGMCDHVIKMIELADFLIGEMYFGSFLARYTSEDVMNFVTFKKGHLDSNSKEWMCDMIQSDEEKEQEQKLNDFLTKIGLGIGVSAYELPAILSRPKELFNFNIERAFLNLRCKLNKDFRQSNLIQCMQGWRDQIRGYNKSVFHPCDEKWNANGECCYGKYLNGSLESIMKIMRLAERRGKSSIDISDLDKNLGYEIVPIGENGLYRNNTWYDYGSLIPFCRKISRKSYEEESGSPMVDIDDCLVFEPVLTELGICHSYNANSSLEMLEESNFKDAFAAAYKTDFILNKTFAKGTGAGKEHAFEFYLMADNFRRDPTDPVKKFLVGITSGSEYFSLEPLLKEVKVGYKTFFNVQPMEIWPTENLHEIPISKRNCRLPEERQGFRFKKYSQSSCELECNLDMAEKICKCLPWYMPPNPQKSELIICDLHGNFCFDNLFKRPPFNHSCSCLPICHDIEFAIIEKIEKLDSDDFCYKNLQSQSLRIANLMKEYLGKLGLVRTNMGDFQFNPTNEKAKEICHRLVQNDIAIVSVTFESKKFVRTIMDKKVSFVDKLATLGKIKPSESFFYLKISFKGGTLGLFTGMSLLSLAEMAFWTFKCIRKFST